MLYRWLLLLAILYSLGHSSPIYGGMDVGKIDKLPNNTINILGQDEFPFMAHITIFADIINDGIKTQVSGICGGVIISEDAILTAAHCLPDNVSTPIIYVHAGLVNFKLESKTAPGSLAKGYAKNEGFIEQYSVSQYLSVKYQCDLAIIWLKDPFTFGRNVQKANLKIPVGSFENKLGLILGWGSNRNGVQDEMLQKAQTRVVPLAECRRINRHVILTDDIFCLRSDTGTASTCYGDSGGPFVVGNNVYGLSSFAPAIRDKNGRTICNPVYPEMFTHIGMFMEWIEEKLKEGPPRLQYSPSISLSSNRNETTNDENYKRKFDQNLLHRNSRANSSPDGCNLKKRSKY